MVDLLFSVERVEAEKYSASPLLCFELRITNAEPQRRVENVMLNCHIRIEPARRSYDARERERLSELFGPAERWAERCMIFCGRMRMSPRQASSARRSCGCRPIAPMISPSRARNIFNGLIDGGRFR